MLPSAIHELYKKNNEVRSSYLTYSRMKCQIYTHSKKYLRNYFILLVCCYLLNLILIEVCILQIKSLSSEL